MMGWFKNLKIARKLQLAFLAVLVLMAILGIFSISQLAKVKNASSEISTDWMPAQKKLGDLKLYFVRLRGTESQLAIYDGDVEAMNGLVSRSQVILTEEGAGRVGIQTQPINVAAHSPQSRPASRLPVSTANARPSGHDARLGPAAARSNGATGTSRG